jgi:hypothetical protein
VAPGALPGPSVPLPAPAARSGSRWPRGAVQLESRRMSRGAVQLESRRMSRGAVQLESRRMSRGAVQLESRRGLPGYAPGGCRSEPVTLRRAHRARIRPRVPAGRISRTDLDAGPTFVRPEGHRRVCRMRSSDIPDEPRAPATSRSSGASAGANERERTRWAPDQDGGHPATSCGRAASGSRQRGWRLGDGPGRVGRSTVEQGRGLGHERRDESTGTSSRR